jgi:hypothetical protein
VLPTVMRVDSLYSILQVIVTTLIRIVAYSNYVGHSSRQLRDP